YEQTDRRRNAYHVNRAPVSLTDAPKLQRHVSNVFPMHVHLTREPPLRRGFLEHDCVKDAQFGMTVKSHGSIPQEYSHGSSPSFRTGHPSRNHVRGIHAARVVPA